MRLFVFRCVYLCETEKECACVCSDVSNCVNERKKSCVCVCPVCSDVCICVEERRKGAFVCVQMYVFV